MDTDLDTLATGLNVTTDDLLRAQPKRVPARPKDSFAPATSDTEMLTQAVRQTLLGYICDALEAILATPGLARLGRQILMAKGAYYGRAFETSLDQAGINLLRKVRRKEKPQLCGEVLTPLRQVIESINAILKGQLDLERHQRRTPLGACARIAQRVLALTPAIWRNDNLGITIHRSLPAYDHSISGALSDADAATTMKMIDPTPRVPTRRCSESEPVRADALMMHLLGGTEAGPESADVLSRHYDRAQTIAQEPDRARHSVNLPVRPDG